MRLPATKVDVVDTTGAGDTVNGALAAELAAGRVAARRGARSRSRAAALSTRAPGARGGMPRARARSTRERAPLVAAAARRPGSRRGRGGSSRGGSSCATSSSRCRTGPRALAGLRAGVHVRPARRASRTPGWTTIRRAVDALNAREPDVHLLLGDYLDASQVLRRDLAPERVADELARLRAPLGTVAVIGNHDWRNSGDRMWRALRGRGITVLEDRAVELRRRSGSPGSPTCATGGRTSAARCARSRSTRR